MASKNTNEGSFRPEQLHALHAASLRLLSLLTVHGVEEELLQKGIESLTALIGARYGAIGLMDEVGKLQQFVYTGLTSEETARIGRLPEGKGLLGVVIHENHTLRLDDMTHDPRAAGFPPNHPPMKSLLAVPVSHEGTMYGRVYLSEKTGGTPFTDEDEQLVTRFAETLALTLRFHRTEAERHRAQRALRNVAHAFSSVTGDEFFRTLVLDLAKALNVDYAFVGRLADERHDAVQTVAVNAKGKLVDNFTYALKGTPCLNVVGKEPCHYSRQVQQQFPDDRLLKEMGIESYIGYPLFGTNGRPLGLLVVMDSKPICDPLSIQAVLQICAARAASEIERLRAEQARQQADAEMRKLASAVAQADDAIVVTDADGFIEYVNPAFERHTGFRREEAVGRTPALVKSGLHDKAFYRDLWGTLKRGEVFRAVFVNRRKNGALFHEEKTITPLKDEAGKITHFVSAGRDITERKRAEEALLASERRNAEMVEQAPDAIITLDLVGHLLTLNPAAERISGYTAGELVGRHFASVGVLTAGSLLRALYEFPLVVAGQERVPVELEIVCKDGGLLFMEANPRLIHLTGQPAMVQVTLRDITERMRAEAALRESERRYHVMADVSPVGIFRTDTDGKCLYVNRRWCEIAGIAPEQAHGDGWAQGLHPDDRERVFREWNGAAREHRPFRLEYRFRAPDGTVTWVLGQATAECDDKGRAVGYVGTVTDITEHKRMVDALRENSEILERIFDSTHYCVAYLDRDFNFIRVNRAYARACAHPPDYFPGKNHFALYPHAENGAIFRRVVETGEAFSILAKPFEFPDHPEWGVTYWDWTLHPLKDAEGRVEALLFVLLDVTQRKRAEQALGESEGRFRALVESTSDWIWETDANGMCTYTSPKVSELLGYAPEEVIGKMPFDFMPPDEAMRMRQKFADILAARGAIERLENVNLHKDGHRVILETSGVPVLDRDGHVTGYRGVNRDVTERKRAEAQLSYLAYYDTLTGLPNRAQLLERLQQAILDADRVHRLVAVMFLDLDRFKYINDTLGHHVGDALLKAVAERLTSCVRAGDTISRLGGDEFTVVLANVAHVDDVAHVARKLIDSFARPFPVEGRELFTTASIGVTLYPFDEREAEGLLKNADAAMYHAKERGRNTFQYYTAELNVRAERRLQIETALRTALERNELSLHYQPQVDTKTGRIVGLEALLRWTHPELGPVSPVEFIPVAEETGLILPIGEWVLREACRQIKAWHGTGFPRLQVAVNLSGKQLRQKDFPDLVRRVLAETKLKPRYLDLELTESLLMVDTEETADTMHTLHDLGVSFSVDDFGTGYSSLAYLKRFPIDVLKIDRSFVRDIATDPNDVAIVKTVIAMAHTLGMKVIAEGVETHEQLAFLSSQGCDGSQGYYCSVPLPAEEFSELLADWGRTRRDRCRWQPSSAARPARRRKASGARRRAPGNIK